MGRRIPLTGALVLAMLAAAPLHGVADDGEEGHRPWRVGAGIGVGRTLDLSYFLVAARLGYELPFGLELGVEGQWWTGAGPSLGKLAPGLTWTLPLATRPYLGFYYARWFAETGGQDALGLRAGVEVVSAGAAALTVGAAYERQLSCSSDSCGSWWPEAGVTLRF